MGIGRVLLPSASSPLHLGSLKMLPEPGSRSKPSGRFIYPPQSIFPRPKFDVSEPNDVHQADLLYLPHDRQPASGQKKTYQYALTVVDVASRFKAAEPLTTKTASEVAGALEKIYKRRPLTWPKLLQVDPRREFMGAVTLLLVKHGVQVRHGRPDLHRDQGIVERWNRTLAERLFGHQYAVELRLPKGEHSTEWAKRLPEVVAAMNGEETRLTGKKPKDAIKARRVTQKPSLPGTRPVGLQEQKLPSGIGVHYLYQPGELEGGRQWATDPIWSLEVYGLGR